MKLKKKRLGDITSTITVMCEDGKWRKASPTEEFVSDYYYKIYFYDNKFNDIGYVKCSPDHLWTFDNSNETVTMSAEDVYNQIDIIKKSRFSIVSCGAIVKDIMMVNIPLKVKCLKIEYSQDELKSSPLSNFQILTSKNVPIYTHNCKNVIAVANTVAEAAEVVRIGRSIMYKRNKEMEELDITDIKDFKPKKPTDKVSVAGRMLNDSDTISVRVDGEEKEITVKELESILNQE